MAAVLLGSSRPYNRSGARCGRRLSAGLSAADSKSPTDSRASGSVWMTDAVSFLSFECPGWATGGCSQNSGASAVCMGDTGGDGDRGDPRKARVVYTPQGQS